MESKLKMLKNCLIGTGICKGLGIILIIVAAAVFSSTFDYLAYLAILIVVIIILLVGSVFTIVGAVTILATDWKDQELNDKRILWGILALVLLHVIAQIIFYVSAKNKIQNQSQPE